MKINFTIPTNLSRIKKNKKMQFVVKNDKSNLRFIPYIGNKSGFAHIFDELIPDKFSKLKFYDLFGGGSAFTLYASQRFGSKNVIYNDNNLVVVHLMNFLKKDPKGLINEYQKHRRKSSSNYYYSVREKDLLDGLVGAGRFLYLAKNAFSGKIRFNPKGKFNCPIRKGSTCPKLNEEQILYVSSIIQDLKIFNKSFEDFVNVKNSLIYLDPPYLNNPNWHYNAMIEPKDFIKFVKHVQKSNKVMISEQNSPEFLKLSSSFRVYPIFLSRSLQYFTQQDSQEIIAINYNPKLKPRILEIDPIKN